MSITGTKFHSDLCVTSLWFTMLSRYVYFLLSGRRQRGIKTDLGYHRLEKKLLDKFVKYLYAMYSSTWYIMQHPWKLQAKTTLLPTSKANLDSSINSVMGDLKDVEVTVENAGRKDAQREHRCSIQDRTEFCRENDEIILPFLCH